MDHQEASQEVFRILQRQFTEERNRHNAIMGSLILATQELIKEAHRAYENQVDCFCPRIHGTILHCDGCKSIQKPNPLDRLEAAAVALDRVGFPSLVNYGTPMYFQNQKYFTEVPDGKDREAEKM